MLFSRLARNRRSIARRQTHLKLEQLEDRQLLSTFTVLNTNDSGAGSLRQAITDANAAGGANQISFDIGSGGTQTITLLSALPGLGSSITLDGTTQPGYSGTPLIVLTTQDPTNNTPGLTVVGNGNTIHALDFVGFFLLQPTNPLASDILVQGNNNLIIANQIENGVIVTGAGNTIGGTSAAVGNQIGTLMIGEQGGASSTGDVVEGNSLANITATNTNGLVIGGTAPGAGNIIPGGISISDSSGALVQANTIIGGGVVLDNASDCTVGGATVAARNVISGNPASNVFIESPSSEPVPLNDVIEGNFIGTQAAGQSPLPGGMNTGIGIDIFANGNTVINNTIAFNGVNLTSIYNGSGVGFQVFYPGIDVVSGTGNRISQNSMFDNGITGIEFGYGVSNAYKFNGPNPGPGPNNAQNFPVIASATQSGGNTVITGTLNSQANSTYTLEFFAAGDRDVGGYVEGKVFLGSQSVTTDGNGNASFTFTGPANPGPFYTATATDANGDTSEFWQPNRPAPTITSTDLSQIAIGVLTLSGSNFFTTTVEEDSGGNSQPIKFISSTQCQIAVSLQTAGSSITFNLFNPGPVGGTSNSVTVTLTANEVFVESLYQTLLGRSGDGSGLAFFTGQLDQGVPRSQVVAEIEASPEYRAVQVQALYQHYMHRAADPSGLAGGVSFLLGGGTVEQLTAGLIGSPEYFQKIGGGNNNGFLGALYHDALNRLLDPAGQAGWTQAFANGATTYQIAGAVITSMEYRQDLVDSYYQTYLIRQADSAGVAGWVALLEQGTRDEAVLAAILGSAEYFNDVIARQ
jgi:hypothetical protein